MQYHLSPSSFVISRIFASSVIQNLHPYSNLKAFAPEDRAEIWRERTWVGVIQFSLFGEKIWNSFGSTSKAENRMSNVPPQPWRLPLLTKASKLVSE